MENNEMLCIVKIKHPLYMLKASILEAKGVFGAFKLKRCDLPSILDNAKI